MFFNSQAPRSAWGRFSANYLFRHTAALYVAVLVCAFAEDVRSVLIRKWAAVCSSKA